jgi:hypothetical protein
MMMMMIIIIIIIIVILFQLYSKRNVWPRILYLPLSLGLLYVGKEIGYVDVKLMQVMIESGIWIL